MSDAQAVASESESSSSCWALEHLLGAAGEAITISTRFELEMPDELTWDGRFIHPEDATLILLGAMHAHGYEVQGVTRKDGGCLFRFKQQVLLPLPIPCVNRGPSLIPVRQRIRVVAMVVAMLVVMVGLIHLASPRKPQLIWQRFNRVQRGMSRAEVEALLGPPGDYTNGPIQPARYLGLTALPTIPPPPPAQKQTAAAINSTTHLTWQGDDGVIVVVVDGSGTTLLKQFILCQRQPQGYFENLGWRIKRAWNRWFSG